ncbi:MAG TPA: helix-turn-helix domain-containing protein, partial [Candidatus Binataceae bacterium]|nr:helix-turn-helix domain-containing protein [Candidatus Binataceae bacterium]
KAQAATEPLKREGNDEASLGKALASAREARGVSREDAAKETRIPGHYLAMMESNDYSKISDQLYMLPFLRRYAQFLELDPEESAMRFVREVQRADNSPSPARLAEPLDDLHRHKRRSRTGAIVVIALIGMIAAAYVAESRHREPAASSSTAVTQALPAAPIGPAMNKP